MIRGPKLFESLLLSCVLAVSACTKEAPPITGPIVGLSASANGGVVATPSSIELLRNGRWKDVLPEGVGVTSVLAVTQNEQTGVMYLVAMVGDEAGSVRIIRTDASGASTSSVIDPHEYRFPTGASISISGSLVHISINLESNAAFSYGALLASTDDGRSWANLGETPAYGHPFFADADHGWIVGGVEDREIFETSNRATNWKAVSIPQADRVMFGAPGSVSGKVVVPALAFADSVASLRLYAITNGSLTELGSRQVALGYDSSGFPPTIALGSNRAVAVMPPTGDVLVADASFRIEVFPHALPVGAEAISLSTSGERVWSVADGALLESTDLGRSWKKVSR